MAELLITGGAGFIGTHSCLVLLEAGHNLVVLDNFDNSSRESLKRVLELAGPSAAGRLQVVEGDIRSAGDLERAFKATPTGRPITAVVHFAGLKAVGESLREPPALLGREPLWLAPAAAGDAGPWVPQPGVQQQRHPLRHAGASTDP